MHSWSSPSWMTVTAINSASALELGVAVVGLFGVGDDHAAWPIGFSSVCRSSAGGFAVASVVKPVVKADRAHARVGAGEGHAVARVDAEIARLPVRDDLAA